jgi:prolyl-tRNA editing enzyme YbaK/EbsC (Cys-tRNA(Pro) deacylase)
MAIQDDVIATLDGLGVDYEVIECDPDFADTAAFCEKYGYAPEISANTIVVASKSEPPSYVACVVTATTRLDVNNRVRKLMGVRKASFATPEQTSELTGMLIGGVTVFALPPGLGIWVDRRVMELDQIILGGGSRSCKIKVTPDFLHRLPNVEVIDDLARAT